MSHAPNHRHQGYRCECRHRFQVFGSGRHRRFFELDDGHLEGPVVARTCPDCSRRLPTTRKLLTSSGRLEANA
jgi:hypothetical protein